MEFVGQYARPPFARAVEGEGLFDDGPDVLRVASGVAGESVEYAAFGVGLAEQQGDRRGAESFRIAERAGRDGRGERLVLEKFRHEETECRQVIPCLEMLFLD